MIEAAMYIALGFFLATMMAAAILPAFYKRAVRLTTDAMKAINPATYAEVRASQDFERASHALALRKVERAVERERENSVSQRLEVGKLTAELIALNTAHKREVAALEAQIQQKEQTAGRRRAKPDSTAAELEKTRARLAKVEEALAAATAKPEHPDGQTPEFAKWMAEGDTMALTTITGLESQISTLKGQLALVDNKRPRQIDPLLLTDEAELRLIIAGMEGELVDAHTQCLSAEAEVARLSKMIDQSGLPTDEHVLQLQEELKASNDAKSRLKALVKARDRFLALSKAQVSKLRQDLRSAPDLVTVRAELTALAEQIAGASKKRPFKSNSARKEPTPAKITVPEVPDAIASTGTAVLPQPDTTMQAAPAPTKALPSVSNANALVKRIVRSSRANATAKPTNPGRTDADQSAPGKSAKPGPISPTDAKATSASAKKVETSSTKKLGVA